MTDADVTKAARLAELREIRANIAEVIDTGPEALRVANHHAWGRRAIALFTLAAALAALYKFDAPAPFGFVNGALFFLNVSLFVWNVFAGEHYLYRVRYVLTRAPGDLADIDRDIAQAERQANYSPPPGG